MQIRAETLSNDQTAKLRDALFDKFRKSCPKQYINAGIAEQNMTGVAAGLAMILRAGGDIPEEYWRSMLDYSDAGTTV